MICKSNSKGLTFIYKNFDEIKEEWAMEFIFYKQNISRNGIKVTVKILVWNEGLSFISNQRDLVINVISRHGQYENRLR
jgi:hypothetical protein